MSTPTPGSTLDDEPPFLTWRILYAVVAAGVLFDIAGLAVLRWMCR